MYYDKQFDINSWRLCHLLHKRIEIYESYTLVGPHLAGAIGLFLLPVIGASLRLGVYKYKSRYA